MACPVVLLQLDTLGCIPNDMQISYKTSTSDYKTQTQSLLVFQYVSCGHYVLLCRPLLMSLMVGAPLESFRKNASISIYRCATATLLLRNSNLTAAQRQRYRCAAVSDCDVLVSRFVDS